jgi:hypothetical protein
MAWRLKHPGRIASLLAVSAVVLTVIAIVVVGPARSVAASTATSTSDFSAFSRAQTAGDAIPAGSALNAFVDQAVPGAQVRAIPSSVAGLDVWLLAGNGDLCIAADGLGQTPATCASASQLASDTSRLLYSASLAVSGAQAATSNQDEGQTDLIVGIVPDGIQQVTFTFGDGSTAVAPVADNGFEVATSHAVTIQSVAWTDGSGVHHSQSGLSAG